jgi:hypothetical protein
MFENRSNSDRPREARANGRVKGFVRPSIKALLVLTLMALAVSSWRLAAEEHVISVGELRQSVLSARQARQNQLRDVHEFLDAGAVQESLRSAGLDAKQLKNAISMLDNDELARLAERTRVVESDLRAGALTNEQLTYIVIALATAVIVILAT